MRSNPTKVVHEPINVMEIDHRDGGENRRDIRLEIGRRSHL